MKKLFRQSACILLVLAGLTLALSPTQAADRFVRLQTPKPILRDLAAMPRIADPVDEAERRINAAVQRLDATVRKAAATCKGDNGTHADWERTVETPMTGPGYISYVISDGTYCGGAHPSFGTVSIVYDLRSGAPVDWTQLLPPSLTGKVALVEGSDGTKMVTLSSKRLYALFLAGYDKARGDDPDCKGAVRDQGASEPPGMMAWLDAKVGGLAVQFDLPHVVQSCADPVIIPLATLRAEGGKPALLDALAAASKGSTKP